MKIATWLMVGDKGYEDGEKFGVLYAFETHSKKDKQTGNWERDGMTSYRFTIFDKDVREIASSLKPKDLIFVAGNYRQREITKKDGTREWANNWVVEMIHIDPRDFNDDLESVREFVVPAKKIKSDD